MGAHDDPVEPGEKAKPQAGPEAPPSFASRRCDIAEGVEIKAERGISRKKGQIYAALVRND